MDKIINPTHHCTAHTVEELRRIQQLAANWHNELQYVNTLNLSEITFRELKSFIREIYSHLDTELRLYIQPIENAECPPSHK
jgi:hypothetical protein